MNKENKEGLIKGQIKKIFNASGESWFDFIILCFAACIAMLIINLAAQDHKVRCYYLSTVPTSAGLAYKVMSDIDWSKDKTAFSSHDEEKTLKVIKDLKQCAAK